MYKCNDCGEWFDEPRRKETTYENYYGVASQFAYGTPLELHTCPFCGCDSYTYTDEVEYEILKIKEKIEDNLPDLKEDERTYINEVILEDVRAGELDYAEAYEYAEVIAKEGFKKYFELRYPEGTRVQILYLINDEPNYPRGTTGTVSFVDDACQIHCKWDNGGSIALLPLEGDEFFII